jgi:hypothetical protein
MRIGGFKSLSNMFTTRHVQASESNEKNLPQDDGLCKAIVDKEHDGERTPWDGILRNICPMIAVHLTTRCSQ